MRRFLVWGLLLLGMFGCGIWFAWAVTYHDESVHWNFENGVSSRGVEIIPGGSGGGGPCVDCVTAPGTLTNGMPVIGSGGKAVSVGSKSGSTSEFATTNGAKLTGQQLAFDGSGNIIASGTAIGGGGGGGSGAPTDAHYLTTQGESGLSNEVNLGLLTSGLLWLQISGNVATPRTAVAGSDYQAPIGFTPENVSNKNTSTSLGTSDTFYPSQRAVKLYTDGAISAALKTFLPHADLSPIDVNSDLYNEVKVTELSQATTLNAPSGGPVEGQRLRYAIYSTVARALTFVTTANGFAANSGRNFPATTIAGAYLVLEFRWSSVSQRWELVDVSRIMPKVQPLSDVATLNINVNTAEGATLTASAQSSYTFANPSGTAFDLQMLRIRVTSPSTAKPLSWGSEFTETAGIPKPTFTTGGGVEDVFGFQRNAALGTWVMIATTQASQSARVRTCMIVLGSDKASAPVLANDDIGPQQEQCFINSAAVLISVVINADAGTPSVLMEKRLGTTNTDLMTGALSTAASGNIACSTVAGGLGGDGVTTCAATLQNTTLPAWSYIQVKSGTAGGTAKRLSIAVNYMLNS